jgi:hypothetical protein
LFTSKSKTHDKNHLGKNDAGIQIRGETYKKNKTLKRNSTMTMADARTKLNLHQAFRPMVH